MARWAAAALLAVAGLGLAGCGTMSNLPATGFAFLDATPQRRIHGGVRHDLDLARDSLGNPAAWDGEDGPPGVFNYWLFGDLPLSAVGDTLTLPITVTAAALGASRPAAPPPQEQDDEAASLMELLRSTSSPGTSPPPPRTPDPRPFEPGR
jgi:uncharacterized protein YceK